MQQHKHSRCSWPFVLYLIITRGCCITSCTTPHQYLTFNKSNSESEAFSSRTIVLFPATVCPAIRSQPHAHVRTAQIASRHSLIALPPISADPSQVETKHLAGRLRIFGARLPSHRSCQRLRTFDDRLSRMRGTHVSCTLVPTASAEHSQFVQVIFAHVDFSSIRCFKQN